MPKKKLIHFQENLTFPFLFQYKYLELIKGFPLKGKWGEDFFGNSNLIILELGCGKGEYTVGLGRKYPEKNFIGMDLKGARLWSGCRQVKEEALVNVAFIRTMVDHIEHFFTSREVSEIWITFPDPQPHKERKRLTSLRFLEKYRRIIIPGGLIHLKTDDRDFFSFTMQVLKQQSIIPDFFTDDLYASGNEDDVSMFRTHYENIWLGMNKKICYVRFPLSPEPE